MGYTVKKGFLGLFTNFIRKVVMADICNFVFENQWVFYFEIKESY